MADNRQTILDYFDGQWEQFYEEYTNLNTTSSGTVKGVCPFPDHNDTKPSFVVYDDGGYKCFGCDRAGDIFDFYAEMNNLSTEENFVQIIQEISNKWGITILQKNTDVAIPDEIIQNAHKFLLENDKILKYLHEKRLLTDEVIKKYKLGWDGERVVIPIKDRTGNWTDARRYSARGEPKILPWKTFDNEEWASKLGVELEEQNNGKRPKNFGDASPSLYPIDQLEHSQLVMAEGEMDGLVLISQGVKGITNTGGAGAWKDDWNYFFKDKKIIFALDNDDTGYKATRQRAQSIKGASSLKMVEWPDDFPDKHDVTDWLHNHSVEELLKLTVPLDSQSGMIPLPDSLERDLIGMSLFDTNITSQVVYNMEPKYFMNDKTRKVFETMEEIQEDGEDINIISVSSRLDSSWRGRLKKWATEEDLNVDFLETYMNEIRTNYLRHRSKQLADIFKDNVDEQRPSEIIKSVSNMLDDLSKDAIVDEYTGNDLVQELEVLADSEYSDTITWGISEMDHEFDLLQNTALTVLISMTSLGKTMLAMNMARGQLDDGLNVGFLSFEMGPRPLAIRFAQMVTGWDRKTVKQKLKSQEVHNKLEEMKETIQKWGIKFNFHCSDIDDVTRTIVNWNGRDGVDIIYLDYLQLLGQGVRDKHQAVGDAANHLKKLAVKYEVPITAISQVHREAIKNQKLTLNSAKESGDIENAVDKAIILEPADEDEWEKWSNDSLDEPELAIKLNKDRLGGRDKTSNPIRVNPKYSTQTFDPQRRGRF